MGVIRYLLSVWNMFNFRCARQDVLVVVTLMYGGVVREHSVKTPNTDYCFFHMEILYVDIYKFVTCSMNIL